MLLIWSIPLFIFLFLFFRHFENFHRQFFLQQILFTKFKRLYTRREQDYKLNDQLSF